MLYLLLTILLVGLNTQMTSEVLKTSEVCNRFLLPIPPLLQQLKAR